MIQKNSTKLSVNLNKIALLRNARGEGSPSIEAAAISAIKAGCEGITLHPRADERHATMEDVRLISELSIVKEKNIEINVEGDLRPKLIDIVQKYHVHQFTIVPVQAGEKTTERGWNQDDDEALLLKTIAKLQSKVRIAIFIEPETQIINYVASLGVDAVEFHTKWYAKAYGTTKQKEELAKVSKAAILARSLGLRINLGHDLNLDNLPIILEEVKPDEVSIGHALIADALSYGLGYTVDKYNKC